MAHRIRRYRRYLFSDALKLAPELVDFRQAHGSRERHFRAQILIACPVKGPICEHKSPRWVQMATIIRSKIPGICNPCSKEGKGSINRDGYRVIRVNKKYVLEHRAVMAQILKRRLRKGETVHHKNGKRTDNQPSNLELRMSGRHPQGWSLRQMREYLKTIPKRLGGLK